MQQTLQEFNDLFARYTPVVQFDPQFNSSRFRRDQQGTYHIGALMMVEAGAHAGRLTARGPNPLEGTDQRFATFIEENQGGAEGLPLFLSKASDSASNKQFQLHRVAAPTVAASGNSNGDDAATATRHSDDT